MKFSTKAVAQRVDRVENFQFFNIRSISATCCYFVAKRIINKERNNKTGKKIEEIFLLDGKKELMGVGECQGK